MAIPYRDNLNWGNKHWSSNSNVLTVDIENKRSRLTITKPKFDSFFIISYPFLSFACSFSSLKPILPLVFFTFSNQSYPPPHPTLFFKPSYLAPFFLQSTSWSILSSFFSNLPIFVPSFLSFFPHPSYPLLLQTILSSILSLIHHILPSSTLNHHTLPHFSLKTFSNQSYPLLLRPLPSYFCSSFLQSFLWFILPFSTINHHTLPHFSFNPFSDQSYPLLLCSISSKLGPSFLQSFLWYFLLSSSYYHSIIPSSNLSLNHSLILYLNTILLKSFFQFSPRSSSSLNHSIICLPFPVLPILRFILQYSVSFPSLSLDQSDYIFYSFYLTIFLSSLPVF